MKLVLTQLMVIIMLARIIWGMIISGLILLVMWKV